MFAKLFTSNDGQVLVTKGLHPEDDLPTVTLSTDVDGVIVDIRLSYEDTDEGYNKRDGYFDSFDQESADSFRDNMIERLDEITE